MLSNSLIDVETNLVHLLKVLENCKDKNIEFTYVSSWFVYGEALLPAAETSYCKPKGFYSITKRTAEQLIETYCKTYNIKYNIVRLGNVVGIADSKVSNKKNVLQFLINELKQDKDINLYCNGEFFRDFIDVNDVADGLKFIIDNNTFGDTTLIDRQYYSNFSSHSMKSSGEEVEKGLFFGMLRSMIFNDGVFLINYLKTLNVPVKLNNEIINRQKVEYLASYKQYLIAVNKDRINKRNMPNPLKPTDPALRDKIEAMMNEPMYVDQKMVSLISEEGKMGWLISASGFEAVVSQQERDIKRIKFKSNLGEFEINCRDYWLANGTHRMPKTIIVKDFKGEVFHVDVINMKHYLEKESDLINRLKRWDSHLKGKSSTDPRPSFLL
jgi:ribosomal protein L7Ae-like RNA K-turn-binding protein